MSQALIERVDPDQSTVRLFHHIDTLAQRQRQVDVEVETREGARFALVAGSPPPRRYDPPTPPYDAYEVRFLGLLPPLPRVWDRYRSEIEAIYQYVPRLLICHLLYAEGGLVQASYSFAEAINPLQ